MKYFACSTMGCLENGVVRDFWDVTLQTSGIPNCRLCGQPQTHVMELTAAQKNLRMMKPKVINYTEEGDILFAS